MSESAATVFDQINDGGTPIVTFSANFATVVPEPATVTRFAAGIGALGVVAVRRRNASAARSGRPVRPPGQDGSSRPPIAPARRDDPRIVSVRA